MRMYTSIWCCIVIIGMFRYIVIIVYEVPTPLWVGTAGLGSHSVFHLIHCSVMGFQF